VLDDHCVVSSPHTIVGTFWRNVEQRADEVALRRCVHDVWQTLTWGQYGDQVGEIAAGLRALGIVAGDRVGILADNRVEWHVVDLATLALGAISVPIYQTDAPAQVRHILNDSGARAVFVDSVEQAAKVETIRGEVPALQHLVSLIPGVHSSAEVTTWGELQNLGRQQAGNGASVDETRPDGVATIVYTSGTTGPPKGVMLTHANIMFTVQSVLSVVAVGPSDRFLSFLPLSHIAERVVSHFGQIAGASETWFARSLATVATDLNACRPTIFFAVPRVWEKLRDAIIEQSASRHGPERVVVQRYIDIGTTLTKQHGLRYAEWKALDQTVGRILRHKLGLDQARVLISGAAPISPALLRWFAGLGLPIGEAYGQTEDCGPATVGLYVKGVPGSLRVGSVGKPLPGVEVIIAADEEVLVRGGSVCAGYWRNDAASAELLSSEGWMHTGDLGRIDHDGYLWITGRKKDIIVMVAGHKVAPQALETELRADPLVLDAVVLGDNRPYITALITLNPQALATWAEQHHKLFSLEALASDTDVQESISATIDRVNAGLARSEQIKRFHILPTSFTAASGELTPTSKVKRNVVLRHHSDVVDQMYAANGADRAFVKESRPAE
jgi:long-chain acyl-CoA synthetase